MGTFRVTGKRTINRKKMVKRKRSKGVWNKILGISVGSLIGVGIAVVIVLRSGWGVFIDKILHWGFGIFFISIFAYIFVKWKRKKVRRLLK